jgi:hypothetical protein
VSVVAAIDRPIHIKRKVTNERSYRRDSPTGTPHTPQLSWIEFVALATAAFAGLTAQAQDKTSTQKTEHDHSSSDPGQENKALLALNPNSNTPPPTDHGDVVPIWYSFDLVKKRVEEGG